MCYEGILEIFVAIIIFLLHLNHEKQIVCTSFTFIFKIAT